MNVAVVSATSPIGISSTHFKMVSHGTMYIPLINPQLTTIGTGLFQNLHLRRRLRHFFEFMSKVTYLCYFFKILCYFAKILCYFFEILCYFFPDLFGLNKNLFHLSNNYVITPIIMCAREMIC